MHWQQQGDDSTVEVAALPALRSRLQSKCCRFTSWPSSSLLKFTADLFLIAKSVRRGELIQFKFGWCSSCNTEIIMIYNMFSPPRTSWCNWCCCCPTSPPSSSSPTSAWLRQRRSSASPSTTGLGLRFAVSELSSRSLQQRRLLLLYSSSKRYNDSLQRP